MLKLITLISLCFFSFYANSFQLVKAGLDNSDWSLDQHKGKVVFLIHVSPSKKELNAKATEAIKKEAFPSEKFSSVAVIDFKSTWIPNPLILSAIKKKQKKYPRTVYLKDKKRQTQKKLEFKSKGNDIFVFDKEGKEVFRKLGKLSEEDIKVLISVLKEKIGQ